MPISFRVDAAKQLTRVLVEGRVTEDEVLRFHRELASDSSFRPGSSLLVDATAADTTEISRSSLESIAEDLDTHAGAFGSSRLAIVVMSDATFGLARMYEALTEDTPTRVRAFRDETEAMEWIRSEEPSA